MDRTWNLPGIRFGVVRGISHGLFGPPGDFVAQARALGAGVVRIYLYWGQVEPEPGRWTWGAVDQLLSQLDGSEEVWVTVCSSSRWATRVVTDFLPPSPAHDLEAYGRFVRRLVDRFAGRARYWQCDNEPCNVGLTWSGTASEYAAQLRTLYRAVKATDPSAAVVLGGAPYPLPASAPDSDERRFFETVLRESAGSFDLFDLHLYADAARIPADVEEMRAMMRRCGAERPVVAGEYNAPSPDMFPEAVTAMRETMAAAFAAAGNDVSAPQAPERAAMAALYERMADLPPQLRMFMAGCSPELEALRDRINCREIVARNLLALSAGVRRTLCWNLGPEIPGYEDHLSMMDLLFGKFALLAYEGTQLTRRNPSAETFAWMAERLDGVEEVARVDVPDRPDLFLFDVRRPGRGPMLAVWERCDPFAGERSAPVPFRWSWPAPSAIAVDALREVVPVEVAEGCVSLPVGVTPVLVSTD